MKSTSLVFAALLIASPAYAGAAQGVAPATPSPAPTSAPYIPVFNDPAMHFAPPTDYYTAPIAPHDPKVFEAPATVAVFVKNPGKENVRVIAVTMQNYEGSLDGFELYSENLAREQVQGVFIKNKERMTLANGMPAYWVELSFGSGFQAQKRYQCEWVDGVRGVTVSISGRLGEVDQKTARDALKDLSATLYPIRRV